MFLCSLLDENGVQHMMHPWQEQRMNYMFWKILQKYEEKKVFVKIKGLNPCTLTLTLNLLSSY
jgi:hypothetical protein